MNNFTSTHPYISDEDERYAQGQFAKLVVGHLKTQNLPMKERGGPAARALTEVHAATDGTTPGLMDRVAKAIRALVNLK